MKKKIVAVLLASIVCALPVSDIVQAYGNDSYGEGLSEDSWTEDGWDEDPDADYEIDPEPDVIEANTLIPEDIRVTPAKKTIVKGQRFEIRVVAAGGSEFDDLTEEEWYDIYERSVESVEFRSTKSNVAYVSRTGRVTARRRGSAVIKTTINLSSGDSITFKTKVYVKKM